MKNLFTLFLCLSCLISCSESSMPFETNTSSNSGVANLLLDKSLKQSNEVLDKQIEQLLKQMKNTTDEKPSLRPIYDVAKVISIKTSPLLIEIDLYRAELSNADGIYIYTGNLQGKSPESRQSFYTDKEGITNFKATSKAELDGQPVKKNNKSLVRKLFVDNQKAETLHKLLQNTRMSLIEEVEALISNLNRDPIRGIRFDPQAFEALKNNLSLLDMKNEIQTKILGELSIGECYPLLRKYQNDARTSAIQIISYLSSNMGTKALVYDEFDVFASSPKPYILLGESYEAEIALGAYSSQAKFSVSVGGRPLKVENGKAKFSARPGSIGTQQYQARITVVNPLTGMTESFSKEFQYEVGVPSASVSADKMNVFYIGIDNPISVAAAGVPSNDLEVVASGGGAKLIKGTGKYNLRVSTPTSNGKYCNIILKNKKTGKTIAQIPFRVKRIPDPKAKLVNGKTDGTIKAGEMKTLHGIMAVLENFDFDARCKIQSFTLNYVANGKSPIQITAQGGKFTGKALQAVKSAKAGDTYIFTNVKGRCPGDKAGRKLNGLAFMIR